LGYLVCTLASRLINYSAIARSICCVGRKRRGCIPPAVVLAFRVKLLWRTRHDIAQAHYYPTPLSASSIPAYVRALLSAAGMCLAGLEGSPSPLRDLNTSFALRRSFVRVRTFRPSRRQFRMRLVVAPSSERGMSPPEVECQAADGSIEQIMG